MALEAPYQPTATVEAGEYVYSRADVLAKARGSLSAVIPQVNEIVHIGNSLQPFRITEIVARDGFTGDRLVANGHYVASKRARVGIPLSEIHVVIPATAVESEAA